MTTRRSSTSGRKAQNKPQGDRVMSPYQVRHDRLPIHLWRVIELCQALEDIRVRVRRAA